MDQAPRRSRRAQGKHPGALQQQLAHNLARGQAAARARRGPCTLSACTRSLIERRRREGGGGGSSSSSSSRSFTIIKKTSVCKLTRRGASEPANIYVYMGVSMYVRPHPSKSLCVRE